jgi:tetratricopeptide (TPR) repeat protein
VLLLALIVLLLLAAWIVAAAPAGDGEGGTGWVRATDFRLRDLPRIAREMRHDVPFVWRASRSKGRGLRLQAAGRFREALPHLQQAIALADQIQGEAAQAAQWSILLDAFVALTVAAANCGEREVAIASIPRALNLVTVAKQLMRERIDPSLIEWERWALAYQGGTGAT